ncbi:MAG: Pilus assembly protein Flp/PilA [Cyanobacteria bacterium RYN_339]|nr:Pilus assembly protein Flp/PilA [Cyanobacteria bacterium RYN_339]
MQAIKTLVSRIVKEEEGQGMVEYSLILALVSVAAIGTLTTMGTNVKGVFTGASNALKATP